MNGMPTLGRRELEIMQVVWDLGEATVRQVCQRLDARAYTTILTMMRTLEEQKKVLAHRVDGKVFIYRAVLDRQQYARASAADLCDRVFGGSVPLLVHGLLGGQRLSRGDIESLKSLLAAQESELNKRG